MFSVSQLLWRITLDSGAAADVHSDVSLLYLSGIKRGAEPSVNMQTRRLRFSDTDSRVMSQSKEIAEHRHVSINVTERRRENSSGPRRMCNQWPRREIRAFYV